MNKVRRKNLRKQAHPDDYWMGLAFWMTAGSRNPSSPQGAVIIGPQGNLISCGCDSPPRCMYDGEFFRAAEKVAIQEAKQAILHGATIYITHPPTPETMLDIVAAEIKRIVYFPTKPLSLVVQDIAKQSYAQVQEYRGNLSWMRDHLAVLKSSGVF